MSMELLGRVEQAEAQAEAIRAQAQQEAREMIKGVEEACVAGERAAALDQRGMSQRILEDARSTAEKRIEAMAADETASREAMVADAKKKVGAAATLIFKRVVEDGNH